MLLWTKQVLFAKHVAMLINFILAQGYGVTLGEVWRSQEQASIYYKEGKGIIDSLHCKRLAIDLNLYSPNGIYLTKSEDYAFAGKYWESLHPTNKWGGNFCLFSKDKNCRVDGNHFEMDDDDIPVRSMNGIKK